jgi:flagellar basal-body rod protein FlgC
MDDLHTTLRISADGMQAQGTRLRIIAENLANADSGPAAPGGEPYRRKVINFRTVLDRDLGGETVRVRRVQGDPSPFPLRFDPAHPAADGRGYVAASNVNPLIEMTDLREAQRSYEANLNMIKASKTMMQQTIELLR